MSDQQKETSTSESNQNNLLKKIIDGIGKISSWLGEKDDGPEQTFLVKAISSGNNLARALIILGFTMIILGFTFSFLFLVTLELLDRFGDQGYEISFSDEGNPIIKIKGKQQLQVISVPAYQKWISSGVTINKNTKIEISATGSIATGLAVPRYLEDLLYKQFNDELGWRLSRLEFNENVYLGWREADGKLPQGYGSDDPEDTIYGSKCIQEESERKKIFPNLEYGVLLGFVADNKPRLEDIILKNIDKSNFFMIGKKAKIEFIEEEDLDLYKVTTYLDGKRQSKIQYIPTEQWRGKTLYFTINEAIVQKEKDLSIFTECFSEEPQLPEHLKKYFEHLEERYKKIYDKLDNPESIWFMDNQGDFTVTIIINNK